MIGFISSLVSGLAKPVADIIDKSITDKDLANRLKNEIQLAMMNHTANRVEAQRDIIVAEAQGESPAQRNWRPHLMYLIMGLMVFNGVAVPLINGFTAVQLPILEAWSAIPGEMWTLLQIGLGGYIVGRSGEKIAKSISITRKQ